MLLGALVLAFGLTRRTFAIVLAFSTAQTLLVQFPDVANHVNVETYCSVVLLVAIAYSLFPMRRQWTDDDCFEMVRPVLQASLILVYALAGFDKLNTDFLDPQLSCVADLVGDLGGVVKGTTFGASNGLVFAAAVGAVVAALLSSRGRSRPIGLAVRAAAFVVVVAAAALAMRFAPSASSAAMAFVILGMAVIVILWELVGGLLLLLPRAQAPVLAFCWMMHTTLSLIGFVDFEALALSLLFTFLPAEYLDPMTRRLRLPVLGRSIPRAHVYFAISVLAGVSSGLHRRLVAAVLFNAAVLVLSWPMLRALMAPAPRPRWRGVGLSSRLTPTWLYAVPVVLLLHGLTSYSGLRTAGNFSMFSNLRTEGPSSNHLLLSGNPLKRWSYQEDVVRFTAIDDGAAAIGYNYQPLAGQALPVVEFRKLIYAWGSAGRVVPMAFEYRGEPHTTADIARDPVWRTTARSWEMRLMDFRVIQPGGPNRCRW